MTSVIGKTLGRYRILERIGEGGMGVVYRASDDHLGRDVALKILNSAGLFDDRARQRLKLEARALSRINHPNIATVFDFDREDDLDYLVTEFISGVTLKERITDGPLPQSEVIDVAEQLMSGLAAAHSKGVVHRDLKPGNLMLSEDGRLKILDFGLAKLMLSATETETVEDLTASQAILGTLPYMPPELLSGESVSPRSDIYSAGAVLYELATGRRPFPDTDSRKLIDCILRGTLERPREICPELSEATETMILKCLEKAPSHRYDSAESVLEAVRGVDGRSRSRPLTVQQPREKGRNLRRVLLAAVLLAIVVVGVSEIVERARGKWWPAGQSVRIDSIAVLPFDNLSGPEQRFFADGVTAALHQKLTQIEGLRVISWPTVKRYRDTKKSLPEIARELGVRAIVAGNVLRSEERVRIGVGLVDAKEDSSLWGETYDRDVVDVLEVQGEVASEIVRQLRGHLTPEQAVRLGRAESIDPSAFDAYSRGHTYLEERSKDGFEKGIHWLELSLEHDPEFAPAHAEIAQAYALLGSTGYDIMPPKEAMALSRAAAERAIELDDELAAAHTALAQVQHNYDWNWSGASESFRTALELNPGYETAHHWYGFHLAALGRLDEAIARMEIALGMNFHSAVIHTSVGRLYHYAGEYDRAISHCEKALEFEEHFSPSYLVRGMAELAKGDAGASRTAFAKGLEHSGGAPAFVAGVGVVAAESGDRAGADRALGELEALASRRYVPAIYAAAIHMGLGEHDRALDRLEDAVEERSEAVLYLQHEPLFAALRGQARFDALLERIRLGGN